MLTVSISMEKDAYHLESYHWTNIQRFHSTRDIKDQKLKYLVVCNQIYKENYKRKEEKILAQGVCQAVFGSSCEIAAQYLNEWAGLWMKKIPCEPPWAPSVICFVPPWYQVQQTHRYCTIRSTTAQKCTHNSTHRSNAKASNSNLLQQCKSHGLREKTQSTRCNVLLRISEDRNTALLIKNTCMLEWVFKQVSF